MRTKTIRIPALLLAVLIAAAALVTGCTKPETQAGAKTITVEVVHSDGSSKTFTYHTDEEYLGAVLQAEGLLVGEDGPYGLYILEVDGERAVYEEDSAYWSLMIGEEYAMQGADLTPVNDGDSFSLVYTVG